MSITFDLFPSSKDDFKKVSDIIGDIQENFPELNIDGFQTSCDLMQKSLLIAGGTNGGKTYFVKQLLRSLLKYKPKTQVVVLDEDNKNNYQEEFGNNEFVGIFTKKDVCDNVLAYLDYNLDTETPLVILIENYGTFINLDTPFFNRLKRLMVTRPNLTVWATTYMFGKDFTGEDIKYLFPNRVCFQLPAELSQDIIGTDDAAKLKPKCEFIIYEDGKITKCTNYD